MKKIQKLKKKKLKKNNKNFQKPRFRSEQKPIRTRARSGKT